MDLSTASANMSRDMDWPVLLKGSLFCPESKRAEALSTLPEADEHRL